MREEFKARIVHIVAKREHVLVKGKHGMGKSYTIQELAAKNGWLYFPFCKPPKAILMLCLEELLERGREHKDYKSFNREFLYPLCQKFVEFLRKGRKRIVIVLDEIHTVTPQAASIFNYLIELSRKDQRITFVALGTDQYLSSKIYRPEMKRFFWELREVEVQPMTVEESKELARNLEDACGVSLTLSDEQRLIKNAKGNPLEIQQQIVRIARQNEERAEVAALAASGATNASDTTEDYGGAIRDQAVNLFPFVLIAVLSIVAVRYLFRGMSLPELAGLSGFIGIITIFAIRIFVYKKDTFTWR